jgi:hypothetical protein
MKRTLAAALALLLIAAPAYGQFDFRTVGTRTQTYNVFTAAPSLPAVSATDTALIVYDPACDCLKVSENGGGFWRLDTAALAGSTVTSFNGRTGSVVSVSGDYSATQVSATPFGTIAGTTVQSQLQQIDARISSAPVTSVFGRTGAVTANTGDYTATKITSTATGDVSATNAQSAIAELASEKVNASTTSTISGTKTFSSTAGILLQPGSAPSANTKILEIKNASAVSKASIDYEGDVIANSVTTPTLSVSTTATITGILTQTGTGSDTAIISENTGTTYGGGLIARSGNGTSAGTSYLSLERETGTGAQPYASYTWYNYTDGHLWLKYQQPWNSPAVGPDDLLDVDVSAGFTFWVPATFGNLTASGTVALGGSATATTPATADNDTSVATTAYVKTNLASYAPLASPALTGNPTAPTAAPGDNDTSIATTGFVTGAIASSGVASFNTRTGAVTPQQADYDGFFLTPTEGDAAYVNIGGDTLTGTLNGTALSMSSATGLTLSNNGAVISHTGSTSLRINTQSSEIGFNRSSASGAGVSIYQSGTTTKNADFLDSTGDLRVRGRVHGGNNSTAISAAVAGEFVGAYGGATATSQIAVFADNTTTAASVGGGIGFMGKTAAVGTNTLLATIHGLKENGTDANTASALRFTTRANGGSLTERARFDSTGRFGIASTSPGAALHVGSGSPVSAWFDSAEDGIAVAPSSAAARVAISGSGSADLTLYDSGAGADLKTSQIINDGGTTAINKVNDAFSSATSMLSLNHSTLAAAFGGTATAPNLEAKSTAATGTAAVTIQTGNGTSSAGNPSLKFVQQSTALTHPNDIWEIGQLGSNSLLFRYWGPTAGLLTPSNFLEMSPLGLITVYEETSFAEPVTTAALTAGGNVSFTADAAVTGAALTAGTMTVTKNAVVRNGVTRVDWTNAMVVAIGATTAGNISAITLPAKTIVRNAYVVITGAAGTVTTLTVSLGRTGASYIDYIVASDAKAAANTVYGDASGERGTNLTGYDMPSFTGTTTLNARFTSTGGNLSTVTGSSGSIYIETATLP